MNIKSSYLITFISSSVLQNSMMLSKMHSTLNRLVPPVPPYPGPPQHHTLTANQHHDTNLAYRPTFQPSVCQPRVLNPVVMNPYGPPLHHVQLQLNFRPPVIPQQPDYRPSIIPQQPNFRPSVIPQRRPPPTYRSSKKPSQTCRN